MKTVLDHLPEKWYPGMVKGFIRSIWRLFCWGLLFIAVLTAVGGAVALYCVHTKLRQYVLAELQERYPGLDIKIGSVQLEESKGLSLRNIDIASVDEKRPLLHIKELFVDCPLTLQNLYQGDFRFRKIVVQEPIFRLTRNADGQFSEIKTLLEKQPKSEETCLVEIINGIFLYEDQAAKVSPLKITGLYLTLTPQDKTWQIYGKGNSDPLRQLSVEGNYNTETHRWDIAANCRQLDWSPELLAFIRLPIQDATLSDILKTFQGRFDFAVSATEDATAPLGFRFAIEGALSQGRAEIKKIRRTLSELQTKFKITDNSAFIEKLSGIAGSVYLSCSYHQEGFPKPQNATLAADIRGLSFDAKFVEILHPFLSPATVNLLSQYEYSGITDLNAALTLQNGSWKPQHLALNLSELNFLFKDFPYQVERLTGSLNIDESAKLGFCFTTKQGETLNAEIVGNYSDVFHYPVGDVVVRASGVPIDAKLLNAFPETQRQVVASLHPSGKINAMLRIIRQPEGLPLSKQFEIGLDRISVQYEKFPYKLRDMFGVLRLNGNDWTFQNVVGTNGTTTVRCDGHLKPVKEQTELLINVHVNELPIDEQIYSSLLDTNQRDLLTDMNIRGRVNVAAQIQYLSEANRLNLRFRAVPCDGLTMKPRMFPYQVENVRGEIYYENGNIFSKKIEAENRETKLQTGLDCQFSSGDGWSIRLAPLTIDRLAPDRELLVALPENLQKMLESLQLSKPVNLNGEIKFSKEHENSPLITAWNTNVLLHQNSVSVGVPVQNIFGQMQLAGVAENNTIQLAGELNIKSLTVHHIQTTDVTGPFFYDGKTPYRPNSKAVYLFLGQGRGRRIPVSTNVNLPILSTWSNGTAQARPLQGTFFGGKLLAEGLVVLENNNFSYNVNTALHRANLAQIAKEFSPEVKKVAGTLNCVDWTIHGNGNRWDTVGGTGKIQLRDANVYEAPGMLKMLRELSIRENDPDAGTFREADIDFRLMGNQVEFGDIVLEGGAFYLKGTGAMRLDTKTMELTMQTRLGKRRSQIPLISNVIGEAGDQFVQLNIHGPISNPAITRVALPKVQKVLQQIQDEAGGPPQVKSAPTGVFDWRKRGM